MSADLQHLYLYVGIPVLLCIILWLWRAAPRIMRRRSRWDELAASFPAAGHISDVVFYGHCTGSAGSISFKGSKDGFSLGYSTGGIIVKTHKAGWPDLLIPWDKVRSAAKYPFNSKVVAKIEIEHSVPLHFYLSGQELEAFQVWHDVPARTLEQLIEDHKRKK